MRIENRFEQVSAQLPPTLEQLEKLCQETGFSMPSDRYIGGLLRGLAASKPGGAMLELGTGIGLSLCWIVDGASKDSKITSIDNDPDLIERVSEVLLPNSCLELVCADGGKWLETHPEEKFDLIFADAWPGKYSHLERALDALKAGGIYLVDDLLPQPNWPDGHEEKVVGFIKNLEARKDFAVLKMHWSTGVLMAVKK